MHVHCNLFEKVVQMLLQLFKDSPTGSYTVKKRLVISPTRPAEMSLIKLSLAGNNLSLGQGELDF